MSAETLQQALRALQWFEQFQARPGEDANERFERVAAAFYSETGYLRPGKDCIVHSPEEREEVWSVWFASGVSSARAAIASLTAEMERPEPVELLKGWKLNHIQFVRGSGKAEIGYLDEEDDRFSPIVTVDTGLYYRPDDALPLARAILESLSAAPTPQEAMPAPQEGQ